MLIDDSRMAKGKGKGKGKGDGKGAQAPSLPDAESEHRVSARDASRGWRREW